MELVFFIVSFIIALLLNYPVAKFGVNLFVTFTGFTLFMIVVFIVEALIINWLGVENALAFVIGSCIAVPYGMLREALRIE